MSRRHLESALVAGAMIESGLSPCFRFSRVRHVHHCYPPGYNTPFRPFDVTLDDESSNTVPDQSGSTVTTTCTCFGVAATADDSEAKRNANLVTTMLGEGDCEQAESLGTIPCRLHMQDYLKKQPWRRLQDDYAVHSVQFTGDGRLLVAGSANTSLRVIDTASGKQRQLPRPSKWTLGMPVTSIRFIPPRLQWSVACNAHGEVFAFNPDSEGFETLFKEPQQTYALDVSPDGCELATGGVDKKIRIYTLQPGSVLGLPNAMREIRDENVSRQTASGRDSIVRGAGTAGDISSRLHHGRLHFPGGRPNQIVDTTTKPYVLTRCYGLRDTPDNTIDLVEPIAYARPNPGQQPLLEYIPTSPGINITEGHSKRIMAVRYHPQKSSLLISAGWDNVVKAWDTRLQTGPVWSIYGPHVASSDGLDMDDDYLLTASWRARSALEIWDMRNLGRAKRAAKPDEGAIGSSTMPATASSNDGTGTVDGPAETISVSGECWCDEPWHSQGEYLYAARLLPSRAVVAGGSGFQEVRVVGRDTLLPIIRVPTDSVVQTLDTILHGRYIGVGCSSGTISLISMA